MNELNAIKVTQRGFAILDEFTDDHGSTITIQESSSVIPSVWVFTSNPSDGRMDLAGHEGKPFKMDMHLGVPEIKRLIKSLQHFVDVKAEEYADWTEECYGQDMTECAGVISNIKESND